MPKRVRGHVVWRWQIGFLGPAVFLTQLGRVSTPLGAVACMMASQGLDSFSQSGLYSNHQVQQSHASIARKPKGCREIVFEPMPAPHWASQPALAAPAAGRLLAACPCPDHDCPARWDAWSGWPWVHVHWRAAPTPLQRPGMQQHQVFQRFTRAFLHGRFARAPVSAVQGGWLSGSYCAHTCQLPVQHLRPQASHHLCPQASYPCTSKPSFLLRDCLLMCFLKP